jgi:hypothetical protein
LPCANCAAGRSAEGGRIFATSASISTSISTCSDIRYKKNITQIPNALSTLQQLNGVYYDWKVADFPSKHFNNNRQIGLIAQEVEKVYPELVETDKDGYKSVDYAKLTPILLEAMKEMQAEMQVLKAAVKALQQK